MKKRKILSMRELRLERGLTIQELSRQIDIPYSTVRAIETGLGKGFSVLTKQEIAHFFGVSLFDLFPEVREDLEKLFDGRRQLQLFIKEQKEKTS